MADKPQTGTPIDLVGGAYDKPGHERRRWARKELLLLLRVSDDLGVPIGEVGDLALGGMALIADIGSEPGIGDELDLQIALPRAMEAGGELELRGVCRWVGKARFGGHVRCGIQFLNVDELAHSVLKTLIGRFVGELSWELRREAHQLTVQLRGSLDEKAALGDLALQLEEPICIDLGDLVRINSRGAGVWLQFLKQLERFGTVTLRRCSPPFVAQLNMIANFPGHATVESVMLPFICDGCDAERQLEQEVATLEADAVSLPEVHCVRCGNEMKFDDLIDRYFAFLRHRDG